MTAEAVAPTPPTAIPVEPRPQTPKSPARHELGMSAKLLFPTREIAQQFYLPLIYTACRTCYSELEPDDIFERATSGQVATEKQQDLIRRVIESGHGSTIEHIVFTFAISGVTRTLSHQLVRHRAGTAISQESLRFVRLNDLGMWAPTVVREDPEIMEVFVQTFQQLEDLQKQKFQHQITMIYLMLLKGIKV